jgi:t-SNARE complex subunit (syntaxin)
MATNRLAELLDGSFVSPVAATQPHTARHDDADANPAEGGESGDVFGPVRAIEYAMATIEGNIAQINRRHSHSLTCTQAGRAAQLRREIEQLTDDTQALAVQTAQQLKGLGAELQAQVERSPARRAVFQHKALRNNHARLTTKFVALTQSFQECQSSYKARQEATIRRQYKLVRPDATEEEVADYLCSGDCNVFGAALTQQLGGGRACRAQAEVALEEVCAKQREVQRLEQCIDQLHTLFVDMSCLVEAQGEILDEIEVQVSESLAYTERGVGELQTANRYAAEARRKTCILFLFLMVVGGGFVLSYVCTSTCPDAATATPGHDGGGAACVQACPPIVSGVAGLIADHAGVLVVGAGLALVCCTMRQALCCGGGVCGGKRPSDRTGHRGESRVMTGAMPMKVVKFLPQVWWKRSRRPPVPARQSLLEAASSVTCDDEHLLLQQQQPADGCAAPLGPHEELL